MLRARRLNLTAQPLGFTGDDVCNIPLSLDFESMADDPDFEINCGNDADSENAAAIGELLDRTARASPEEKVLNSLLYWLIDLAYKVSLTHTLNPTPHPLTRIPNPHPHI